MLFRSVGTFSNYDRTGFKNLSITLLEEAIKDGAEQIDDPYVFDGKGNPKKMIRLEKDIRIKRANDTIQAL